jgi:hypothetical protein
VKIISFFFGIFVISKLFEFVDFSCYFDACGALESLFKALKIYCFVKGLFATVSYLTIIIVFQRLNMPMRKEDPMKNKFYLTLC